MSAGIFNIDVNPGGILKAIFDGIDSLITSDEEKQQLKNDALREAREGNLREWAIAAGLMQGQIDINKIEAGNTNLFVSGWRPFIGWVCGAAIMWAFLGEPMARWGIALWAPGTTLPVIPANNLFELVLAMLGLAGWRSLDKAKGVAS